MSVKKHPLIASKPERKPKPHRKLIALSGFANTGKDTIAKIIKEVSPDPVVIVSFADAVKAECYPTLGKEFDKDNDDREFKEKHRAEIIAYGEGRKHEHGMYYWVHRALDDLLLKNYDRRVDYPHIIIADCRRTEEMMWFKHFKLGHFAELKPALEVYEPIMMVVHREGAEKDKDFLTHVALEYASETRMFHKMIKNYGTEKELKQKVLDIYATLIK